MGIAMSVATEFITFIKNNIVHSNEKIGKDMSSATNR